MQRCAIEVVGLRARYPGSATEAVRGVDFAVECGEVFGLLGPNGAGKSTTQRVLTGHHRGYSGRAEVLGRPVAGWGAELYRRIGVGFELPAYIPRLTARENLATFAALYGGGTNSPEQALAEAGLADVADRRVETFSKGEKMRLNLARACLHRPELLFLDEPTSGLDPASARQVKAMIRAQADAGSTVLLATHDMATAEELCTRIAFMAGGTMAAVDTPRNLRLAYGRRSVVVEYEEGGRPRRAEFPAADDPGLLALLATGRAETVHTREAPLSDVFVALAGALDDGDGRDAEVTP